jgi:UDP-N-acetylglucosamine 2-epimerase (non-hydrolysing)
LAHKILFLFGTRPEAIKLAPVLQRMQSEPERFSVSVCVTAQHRAMLDQVLGLFGIRPDFDLNLMTPGQTLTAVTARMMAALEGVFGETRPDLCIVQGDTTTTFCGALASFYARVPVAHVEAGLRTWDNRQPFPEEINRVLTGKLAELHLAATDWAAENLRREGVSGDRIAVTGNSGIDAVLDIRRRLEEGSLGHGEDFGFLDEGRKLILVTAHRRESFGEGFERICRALNRLASREDVQMVYPVHPNPNVRAAAERWLAGNSRLRLIAPLDYVPFVDLMRRAHILVTDSGGVQEEGPSLGKPILVLREKTERPEAVEAGTVVLTGTDEDRIVREAELLLENAEEYARRSRIHNPYGDGHASGRISDVCDSFLSKYSS